MQGVVIDGDGDEVSSWGEKHKGSYIRGSQQKYDFIKIMIYEENMTHGLVFLFYQAAAFYFLWNQVPYTLLQYLSLDKGKVMFGWICFGKWNYNKVHIIL